MKIIAIRLILFMVSIALTLSSSAQQPVEISQPALPGPAQILWQEMEQTMFIHFDPATWQGSAYDNHSTPLSQINPDRLDVNQWIDVAESWGAKMIIFVAKHVGGFCWWQTETTAYSIKSTPYKNGKGDVLANLSEACRNRGMKLGIYIYPGDESFGAYLGGGGRTRDSSKQEAYNRVLRQQWTEVLSRTPGITEIWFDGSVIVPLEDIIRQYAPDAIVFQGPFADIRWVGNEGGYAPYPAWNSIKCEDATTGTATAAHGDPDGDCWMPVEVDVPLKNHDWFWSPTNYKNLRSIDELVQIYYKSVGRGCQLLLNAAPDTNGLIPPEDVVLYKQLGEEIKKRFGKSIAETSGKGNIVQLDFDLPVNIDHLILQEDIAFGERVRRYVIEGRTEGEWFHITSGISIGHKRIEQFKTVNVKQIRLRVTENHFPPVIKRMAAFFVNDPRFYDSSDPLRDDLGNLWIKGQQNSTTEEKMVVRLSEIANSDGTFNADLSAMIALPGQYIITLKNPDTGKAESIESGKLFLMDMVTPGFISTSDEGLSYRINITAFPKMEPGSIRFQGKVSRKCDLKETVLFIREIKID
ncbi:MAG: alpha-L-fucosidase [Bacteroidales bacterium]|nr:alpha-L-fucosidase [Bacteroidales bacterium]